VEISANNIFVALKKGENCGVDVKAGLLIGGFCESSWLQIDRKTLELY
jgi:hypothetical protein